MATVLTPTPPSPPEPEETVVVPRPDLYEVIGTEIVEKTMGAFEASLLSVLIELLGSHVWVNRLGRLHPELLFDLRPTVDRSRRPDLAYVSAARWPLDRLAPRGEAWRLVPDLAIEVVSPSNSASEVAEKVREYRKVGVTAVWVIYPELSQVYIFSGADPTSFRVLERHDVLEQPDLLPGFRLPLADLFLEEPAA
jgi:Uma2 family endonuclease